MKRKIGIMFLLAAMLCSSAPAFAEDTVIDKMTDWFATAGKSQQDKDQILMQRHIDRAAKKTGDAFHKAGKDLEKAFK